ncbi:MAG: RagB/SusD family nutrient uptake outer membrane protein [Sulfuricurvum sp.]|nr:RagB/SusD family nutrient uptake outer membrane protein [Sulfuricurvum sp.]
MKKINLFSIICFVTLLVGCNDKFLDVAPDVAIDEAKVFSNPVLAAQYADNAYRYRPDDYLRWNSIAGMSNVTDESVGTDITSTLIYTLQKGMWHDHSLLTATNSDRYFLNDIAGVWGMSYSGIHVINKMLSKIDLVPWTTQDPGRIKGEMYFLRASMYFELIKRFGGVVIMDKDYAANDDIDFPRSTYEECVSFILNDIEQAILLLPINYDQGNYGRATSGAARALKSRLLLYAASPLNNSSNDLTKWAAAASAAQDVIDMNKYKLHKNYGEILNIPMSDTCEYILIKVRGPIGTPYPSLSVMSPGSGGSNGEFNPTQNHVDLYEMSNGLPISDPASGYTPTDPYANRDPRFYANILYNGATWQGRKMEMWDGGKDYRSIGTSYTQTRYYCKKMWPVEFDSQLNKKAIINFIFFRYGEILLNFAEAQNEAVGPDARVYNAINQIRKRAGMPDLPVGLTQEKMRDRIRNERAIELAFEDHRFYDVMRWKKGKEIIANPVYGMNVVKNTNGTFTYTPIKLNDYYQRVFEDFMHLYPIPRTEIQKSKKLIQNPGW